MLQASSLLSIGVVGYDLLKKVTEGLVHSIVLRVGNSQSTLTI